MLMLTVLEYALKKQQTAAGGGCWKQKEGGETFSLFVLLSNSPVGELQKNKG